jgi:hypothetical protein
MGFGIFIHRSDSIYNDRPAEQYQFPRPYLSRVEACVGNWIIYYEPSKVNDTRGDPFLGEYGPWDRFDEAHHSIHISYHAHADRITRVTVMRADAVP